MGMSLGLIAPPRTSFSFLGDRSRISLLFFGAFGSADLFMMSSCWNCLMPH